MDAKNFPQLLFKAIEAGDANQARELLREGVDPAARDWHGTPALSLAALMGRSDCVKALIEAGAPLDATDADGKSTAACEAVSSGALGCLKALLEAGANPNAGASPLTRAIDRGAHDMARLLLERGADPAYRQRDGRDCAMLAAWSGDPRSLAMLIEAGADLSARDEQGRDAARWAVEADSLECLRLLDEAGVDFSLKDGRSISCLDAARGLGFGECESFLVAWEQARDLRQSAREAPSRPVPRM